MAFTGQSIADLVKVQLIDPDHIRWGEPEYLQAINDAMNTVVDLRPESHTVDGDIPTVAGATQTLPADGLRLIRVMSVGNRALTETSLDTMDSYRPQWRTDTGEPDHYLYDDREPRTFYLYPGPVSAGQARARYVKAPQQITDLADAVPLNDLYQPAMHFFVLSFLLRKDTGAADFQKAGTYYAMAVQVLSGKVDATQMLNPEQMTRRMKP